MREPKLVWYASVHYSVHKMATDSFRVTHPRGQRMFSSVAAARVWIDKDSGPRRRRKAQRNARKITRRNRP